MRRSCFLVVLSACDLVFPLRGPGDGGVDAPVGVVGCSSISMLADDFSDLTRNWTTGEAGSGSVDANAGQVTFSGANMGDRASLVGRHYYDLRDGAFTIEVTPLDGPPTNSHFDLRLVARAPFQQPQDQAGMSIVNDGMGNRQLRGFYVDGGEFAKFSDPLTPNDAVWQIARTGDTIEWRTAPSVDGPFTVRGSEVLPDIDFVRVEFNHVNDSVGGGSFSARIQNANGGVPSGEACPIGELVDAFVGPEIDRQWAASTAVNCTMTPNNGIELVPMGAAGYDCSLRTATIYDLRGGEIGVELGKLAAVAGQDFDLQLNVRSGSIAFQVRDGLLAAIGTPNGEPIQFYRGNIDFDLGKHKHLRIREQGGMVIWETSDGVGPFQMVTSTTDFASEMDQVEVQISLTGTPTDAANIRRVD